MNWIFLIGVFVVSVAVGAIVGTNKKPSPRERN